MESAAKIILTNRENEVLLQLRDKDHSHTGCRAMFGGHIDGNETPEEALIREIKEEINYDIEEYSFIKESVLEEFGKIYLFHGYVDVPLEQLTLREGDDFRFFSLEDLSEIEITPYGKAVLTEYFKSQEHKQ
jgi:8-oxo-dGTP diphosphatase